MVMMGATIHAAENPAVKSVARRRPRCFVFHIRVSCASFAGRVRVCVVSRHSFEDGMSTIGGLEVIFCSFHLTGNSTLMQSK